MIRAVLFRQHTFPNNVDNIQTFLEAKVKPHIQKLGNN